MLPVWILFILNLMKTSVYWVFDANQACQEKGSGSQFIEESIGHFLKSLKNEIILCENETPSQTFLEKSRLFSQLVMN